MDDKTIVQLKQSDTIVQLLEWLKLKKKNRVSITSKDVGQEENGITTLGNNMTNF